MHVKWYLVRRIIKNSFIPIFMFLSFLSQTFTLVRIGKSLQFAVKAVLATRYLFLIFYFNF